MLLIKQWKVEANFAIWRCFANERLVFNKLANNNVLDHWKKASDTKIYAYLYTYRRKRDIVIQTNINKKLLKEATTDNAYLASCWKILFVKNAS